MKVGVIGYGARASHVAHEMTRMDPHCTVAAIADPQSESIAARLGARAAGIRFFRSSEEMLDSVSLDGIMIGTRCSLHAEEAVKVLPTGIPLFMEKPVAISVADLLRLKQAYRAGVSKVVVSFPLRFTPIVQLAKEVIDSGKIGHVDYVQAVNHVPYGGVYYQNWYRDERETGGLFLQKATHDFDYIRYLVGSPAVEVSAMTSKQVFKGDKAAGLKCVDCQEQETCPESAVTRERRGEEWIGDRCCFATDTGNEDSGSALLRFERGLHAVYSQNFFARRGAQARGARLIGYKGTLDFDFYQNELTVFLHHTDRVERHRLGEHAGAHFGGDEALIRNFADVMKGEADSRSTLEDGMTSALLCLHARESARLHTFRKIAWHE